MGPITATFIGGPWDLHRVALPEAKPTVEVLEHIPQRSITFNESAVPESPNVRKVVYRRHNLYGQGGDVFVYVADD